MPEFDKALWGSLVEYVTFGKDKMMVFTLIGGNEMKAFLEKEPPPNAEGGPCCQNVLVNP